PPPGSPAAPGPGPCTASGARDGQPGYGSRERAGSESSVPSVPPQAGGGFKGKPFLPPKPVYREGRTSGSGDRPNSASRTEGTARKDFAEGPSHFAEIT